MRRMSHRQQSEEVDPLVEELWNSLYVLESQNVRSNAQGDIPCFHFAKGRCTNSPCGFSHAPVQESDSYRGTRQPPPARERYRSRSPRRKQLPVRFQLSPTHRKESSFEQPYRGGGGKDDAEFPPNDHPTACFQMFDTSKCGQVLLIESWDFRA